MKLCLNLLRDEIANVILCVGFFYLLCGFTDWYDIKAPSIFDTRNVGKTLINRSAGMSAFYFYCVLNYDPVLDYIRGTSEANVLSYCRERR